MLSEKIKQHCYLLTGAVMVQFLNSPNNFFLPGPEATLDFGQALGCRLAEAFQQKVLVLPGLLTLTGDLGAGKTTFCQGLGKGLAVDDPKEIVSPTFTLANEYPGPVPLFHLDLYRLASEEEFHEAGLDEYLTRPGLTLVEWPFKMPVDFWPKKRLDLTLIFQSQGRLLKLTGHLLSILRELKNKRRSDQ
jgi:tRNA threonylcarbamoyladenosine biosynthesis protein TsaE